MLSRVEQGTELDDLAAIDNTLCVSAMTSISVSFYCILLWPSIIQCSLRMTDVGKILFNMDGMNPNPIAPERQLSCYCSCHSFLLEVDIPSPRNEV